ncbi:MAG: MmgE/PrpD family protein, partial [Candidatus Puniceispirillales bacterium]
MTMLTHVQDVLYGLKWSDLPPQTQHQAKRCLMDLIGVFASGTQTPMSRISTEHASRFFVSPDTPVRLLGDGRPASAPGVAMAGAYTIDSIDAHDGMKNTKGHAGSIVLPSLIALLEASGRDYDDEEFMTCLVLGYEIAIRDGIALHASVPDYHTSGAWAAVGVAALGARILGLDRQQMEEAIGIAEYNGPRSQMMRAIDHPTMVKDGAGWGAMAGVSAALLAQDGFTGAPAITITNPDLANHWADLGSTWHIVNQYIKPWPVCRWAQPAATAVMHIMQSNNIAQESIDKISVKSFHEAIRLATRIPVDTEDAQYSLPWPVAAAAVRGKIGAAEISAPFDDPRITELARGMELLEDDYCNQVFPGERLAQATIITRDGASYSSEIT